MAVVFRVDKRFFADSVAGKKKQVLFAVEYGKREHAPQRLKKPRAAFLVEMNDHFDVAVGIKPVAALFKLRSKLFEIIYFPVTNYRNGFIFVINRLVAGFYVNYGEPPHTESRVPADMYAFVIRAAMREAIAHRAENRLVRLPFQRFGIIKPTANSTHFYKVPYSVELYSQPRFFVPRKTSRFVQVAILTIDLQSSVRLPRKVRPAFRVHKVCLCGRRLQRQYFRLSW